MRTVLLLGVLAACLVVTYARYKSTDFTHAGEESMNIFNKFFMYADMYYSLYCHVHDVDCVPYVVGIRNVININIMMYYHYRENGSCSAGNK